MPNSIKQIKIFLASPSGLEKIRNLVEEEMESYNKTDSEPRGIRFKIIRWENICTGMGNLQEQINPHLCSCDYYLLILHNRWGSPPDSNNSQFSSGSEKLKVKSEKLWNRQGRWNFIFSDRITGLTGLFWIYPFPDYSRTSLSRKSRQNSYTFKLFGKKKTLVLRSPP